MDLMTINEKVTMTSIELAEYLEVEHKTVLRSIQDRLIPILEDSYREQHCTSGLKAYKHTGKRGKEVTAYILDRKQVMFICMPYSKELQWAILGKIEELTLGLPTTRNSGSFGLLH